MLMNVLYAIGVILVILGVIGLVTDLGTGVGLTGIIVGIVIILVAKFVVAPRGRV